MKSKTYKGLVVLSIAGALLVAGCGKEAKEQPPVEVNAYKIVASDSNVVTSFNGTVMAQKSVPVRASVSGRVVEKYVTGGQTVEAGQPLYRLDSRQLEASLATAEANAARQHAIYENAQADLARYEMLAKEDAIARRTLDSQASLAEQNRAALEANRAAIRLAQENLSDTVVYAPFSGTLEMDDIALGTFVTAGGTTLVTINSIDPVYLQFSMSESEYLDFMKANKSVNGEPNLELRLSDGSIYGEYDGQGKLIGAYKGSIVEMAKNVDSGTGQLIIKASFPNPKGMLLPNMYGTVLSGGDVIKDAILVPSRAILPVLDKSFVLVLDKDGKVEQRPVVVGGTQGMYTIVKSGLKVGDEIIVDGLTKARNGMIVKATLLTKEQVEKGK